MKPKNYCVECDKSFPSGKALGGHKSSYHVQGSKNNLGKKKSSEPKNLGSDNIDLCSRKYVCPVSVCEREFKSKRSLYGHMRCHPERDWRGVKPPAMKSFSHEDSSVSGSRNKLEWLRNIIRQGSPLEDFIGDDSSEEDGDRINYESVGEASNLSKVFSGCKWGITGRRGQPRSIPPHVSSSSCKPVFSNPVDDDVINASYLLMCLKNSWVPTGKHPMIEYNSMCNHSKTKNPTPDADDSTSYSENLVAEALLDLRSQSFKNSSNGDEDEVMKPKVFKRPQFDNVYSCHQDLGGHMSTHTKLEKYGINQSEKKHQCKTCNRAFFSGQALGGHQSRHRNESSPSSSKAPFSEEDNSNPNLKALKFDLNESPVMEDQGYFSL